MFYGRDLCAYQLDVLVSQGTAGNAIHYIIEMPDYLLPSHSHFVDYRGVAPEKGKADGNEDGPNDGSRGRRSRTERKE